MQEHKQKKAEKGIGPCTPHHNTPETALLNHCPLHFVYTKLALGDATEKKKRRLTMPEALDGRAKARAEGGATSVSPGHGQSGFR